MGVWTGDIGGPLEEEKDTENSISSPFGIAHNDKPPPRNRNPDNDVALSIIPVTPTKEKSVDINIIDTTLENIPE